MKILKILRMKADRLIESRAAAIATAAHNDLERIDPGTYAKLKDMHEDAIPDLEAATSLLKAHGFHVCSMSAYNDKLRRSVYNSLKMFNAGSINFNRSTRLQVLFAAVRIFRLLGNEITANHIDAFIRNEFPKREVMREQQTPAINANDKAWEEMQNGTGESK